MPRYSWIKIRLYRLNPRRIGHRGSLCPECNRISFRRKLPSGVLEVEIVASEDFSLTPEVREEIHQQLAWVRRYIGEQAPVSVFLSKEDVLFLVRIQVRIGAKLFSGVESSPSLKVAIARAKDHLLRQILAARRKSNRGESPHTSWV